MWHNQFPAQYCFQSVMQSASGKRISIILHFKTEYFLNGLNNGMNDDSILF